MRRRQTLDAPLPRELKAQSHRACWEGPARRATKVGGAQHAVTVATLSWETSSADFIEAPCDLLNVACALPSPPALVVSSSGRPREQPVPPWHTGLQGRS